MMRATDILRQAGELGITLSITKDKIQFKPKSAAPPEFIEALRRNKPTIIDELALLERLVKGQSWLTGCVDDFLSGATTATPVTMPEMMDLWGSLEDQLRDDFRYVGCIHGTGKLCPEDAQVMCDGCIGVCQ